MNAQDDTLQNVRPFEAEMSYRLTSAASLALGIRHFLEFFNSEQPAKEYPAGKWRSPRNKDGAGEYTNPHRRSRCTTVIIA